MKVQKNRVFLASTALVGALMLLPGTAMAATEKDAALRLNVMNLDCTIDQILEGNSPTYIVNPAGCYVPPVIEIITPTIDTPKQEQALDIFAEPFLFTDETPAAPDTYGPVASLPEELPTYPKDAVPITSTDTQVRPGSVFITGVAVGSTIVASTIVVDVLIFNAQLVNATVSVVRRVLQFILSIAGR